MGWTMFLDSSRAPMYSAIAARSVVEAKQLCLHRGAPSHLVLEYYLGAGQATGLEFVEWLVKVDKDMGGRFIPQDFTYYIHSQNSEGIELINELFIGYLEERSKKETKGLAWGNLTGNDFTIHTFRKNLLNEQ